MRFSFGHIILFTTWVLITGTPLHAQISPGELAKVHSHLEGMSNCTKCHILGEKVSNSKCLECHTELKARIDLQKGYHSSAEVRGKECVRCHSDHHGLAFQIVRFDKSNFDHTLAGFALSDTHSNKQCTSCHKSAFIKDPDIRKKKFTYLGLNPECLTCHTDYHQKTLSVKCEECHDFETFSPAKKFDHKRAGFQLTGKHQDVPCLKCHKIGTLNGLKFQEFKGIKFAACSNCHTDPHQNKFGQNCSQCHTDQSFTIIKIGNNFDHNKTDFKLEGRHQQVDCKLCHKAGFTTAIKSEQCRNCHNDYHDNQFAVNGVSPDCSSCHTVDGFAGSSFTIEKHNKTSFRLEGGHLATPCFACHKKGEKWSFREIGRQCRDCHKNIHENYISEKYYPDANCESCHNVSRWNSVSFDHSKTTFEITGSHAKKSCRDCHFKSDAEGVARQQFRGLSTNCSGCHEDVHASQFDNNGITDCSKCHTFESFKPASRFDHSKTRFPLDGKHVNVACIKCHKEIKQNEKIFVLYKIKEFKCEDCHH